MNLKQLRLDEEKKINSSNLINQSISTNNQVTTTNNVTYNYISTTYSKVPVFKGAKDINEFEFIENNTDTFPTYLSNCETITIPKKVKRQISKLPKSVLSKIDSDKTVAVEKCLDFVSNFTGTIFFEEKDDKWVHLRSTYLDEKYKKGKNNTHIYVNVIKALTYSTNSTNPIIEIKKNQFEADSYKTGEYSKAFRLNSPFVTNNLKKYTLTNEDLILKRRKHHLNQLNAALQNRIGYNLLMVYKFLDLPTIEEIELEGDRLIQLEHKTKKGKLLAKISNRKKENIPDFKKKSFVEENLKQFEYLVQNGYFIPKIGGYKSGGRVVDSFNLMPSWIRALIKIDGEDMVEVDFGALHPNLAMNIYSGKSKHISHKTIAERLDVNIFKVKKAHLSFFNETIIGMKRSVLFKYYEELEPELLMNIINEKKASIFGHKITSMRMFELEVVIMTEVITRLNQIGIYVLYIYDALSCKKSDQLIVQKIMNEVVVEFGVYTTASV